MTLKAYLLRQKDGLYMLVLLASPRWRWCPGEYLLVSYRIRNYMELVNIRQDTNAIWEKLIKRTHRAHLFDEVSMPLKCNLLGEKDGLYMLVLLVSPRWRWCPGEYLLVSFSMIFCMEPEYIRQDISATWEKLIKPT